MKHIVQEVSPDEYDEAVRHDPTASTLSATGDLRTGQQLLLDAAEDRLRSVGWMAVCPRGRAELDKLAAAAEGMAGRWQAGVADGRGGSQAGAALPPKIDPGAA